LECKTKTPAGRVADVRPRRLAEEAHGLPAESEVLHGNHERYIEAILILFVMTIFVLSQSLLIILLHHTSPHENASDDF